MQALEQLWDEVSTADWVATTGIPLVVAVVAIRVAVQQVKRQISNDRLLRSADRVEREVHAIGAHLTDAANRLKRTDPSNTQYWTSSKWPDLDSIARALRDGVPFVERELREQASEVAARVGQEWGHLANLSKFDVADMSREVMDGEHGWAMRVALTPLATVLERVATQFAQWEDLDRKPPLQDTQLRALRETSQSYEEEYYAALERGRESGAGSV